MSLDKAKRYIADQKRAKPDLATSELVTEIIVANEKILLQLLSSPTDT